MSFSHDLKKELGSVVDAPRHCRLAELASIVMFLADAPEEGGFCLRSPNVIPLDTAAELIRKLFGISLSPSEEQILGQRRYFLEIPDPSLQQELIRTLKCSPGKEGRLLPDAARLTGKSCCKRAFLRGAFLCAGTISDPDRSYHLEINCKTPEQAEITAEMMQALHIEPGLTNRNRYYSVYIKDGDRISDAMGLMGARVSLLELENRRIIRSMRGTVNRRVNCETANIGKTAAASARQIEDIRLIEESGNQDLLTGGLDELARLRVKYPEATLNELAQMMDPPLGRSGINHRLRKICSIAEKIREEQSGAQIKEAESGKTV